MHGAYRQGKEYEISDKTAEEFIRLGRAKPVLTEPQTLVDLLPKCAAGLLILPETSPDLVKAARKGRHPDQEGLDSMAANALAIVSVPDMKDELRIPGGVTSQDALLKTQIEAAVSFVSSSVTCSPRRLPRNILLQSGDGRFRHGLRLRGPEINQRDQVLDPGWIVAGLAPDGTIAAADLGRIQVGRYDWQTHSDLSPRGWAGRRRSRIPPSISPQCAGSISTLRRLRCVRR